MDYNRFDRLPAYGEQNNKKRGCPGRIQSLRVSRASSMVP